jgi:hypothetical protein
MDGKMKIEDIRWANSRKPTRMGRNKIIRLTIIVPCFGRRRARMVSARIHKNFTEQQFVLLGVLILHKKKKSSQRVAMNSL